MFTTSSARLFAPFLPPPGEPNIFFIVATVSIDVNVVRSCLNFVFKLILHDCGSVRWVQCPHVLDKVLERVASELCTPHVLYEVRLKFCSELPPNCVRHMYSMRYDSSSVVSCLRTVYATFTL